MPRMFTKNLCKWVLAAAVAPALADVQWQTDLPAALEQAAKENKAVLVDFTGSDWCGYCIRLRKEILDTPEFEAYIADKFVPVEVDVPRKPKFSPEQLEANRKLCAQYKVQGFPTIMVLSPEGKTVGGFVGGRPDMESVKEPLEAARANIAKLGEIAKLEGMEKARALAELLTAIPDGIDVSAYEAEILALDPEDTLGFRHAKEVEAEADKLSQSIGTIKEVKEQLAKVNELLPTVQPENKPMMLFLRANLMIATSETLEDIAAARAAVVEFTDSIPNITPEERAKRMQRIEADFADPEIALKNAKKMRAAMEGRR